MNKWKYAGILIKLYILFVLGATVVTLMEFGELIFGDVPAEKQLKAWDEWMLKHEDLWTR